MKHALPRKGRRWKDARVRKTRLVGPMRYALRFAMHRLAASSQERSVCPHKRVWAETELSRPAENAVCQSGMHAIRDAGGRVHKGEGC